LFHHKVDFINKNDDIERSYPKQLHFPVNKQEFNLTNLDIVGSTSQCVKFKTTRDSSNPLEPKYKLPYVEELPEEVPKFIRDSIDIKDIDGARPKKYFRWGTRDGVNIDDIYGTKTKIRKIRKDEPPYHYIDYSDVTDHKFKSKRRVDPLDPIYELKYKNGYIFNF
jgi:hypothetical protein